MMNLAIIPPCGGSKRIPTRINNIGKVGGPRRTIWPRRPHRLRAHRRMELGKISKTYREVLDGLRSHGVGAHLHYNPIRLHLRYRRRGVQPSDFPISESYYEEAISLPMFPVWKELELADVARTLAALTGPPR